MGKKKKNKEAIKPKHKKNPAVIDERVKHAYALQPPDENPYKQENEKTIDRFLRYGFKPRREYIPIKQKKK